MVVSGVYRLLLSWER
jgi:hypothetical protein